jgi:DNA-binding CsgD family transcriptional regulator
MTSDQPTRGPGDAAAIRGEPVPIHPHPTENPLSEREMEVARLLATGASNAEIARELVISPHTVKVHLRNVFEKLQVSSRTEASMVLLQRGWLTVPGVEIASGLPVPVATPAQVAELATELPVIPAWWQMALVGLTFALVLAALLSPRWSTPIKPPLALLADAGTSILGRPAVEGLPRWEPMPTMSRPTSRLAAAAVGNHLYAVGGETLNGVTLDRTAVFDLSLLEWRGGPRLPNPRANLALTAAGDGTLIVAGGSRIDLDAPPPGIILYDDLLLLESEATAWQAGGSLPTPLAGAALVMADDALYLIGGWDGERLRDEVWGLPVAQAATAMADDWLVVTRLAIPTAFLGAAAVGETIYVAGGFDGRRELATAALYDIARAEWRDLPPLTTPRGGLALVYDGVAVLALGGGWTQPVQTHERYDTLNGTWTPVDSPIRGEWRHLAAAARDGSVYIVGGWSGDYLDGFFQFQSTFRALLPAIPNLGEE